MIKTILFTFCVVFCFLPQTTFSVEKQKNERIQQSFPWRETYPHIKWIELEEFSNTHSKYLIIDVRSKEEFNVIHIKNAYSANFGNYSFNFVIKKLHDKYPNKPFAFYCNGHQCKKSFLAAIKAKDIFNIDATVYDAGILDFAKANPKSTVLLNKPMSDSNFIISNAEYSAHVIDYFEVLNIKDKAIIIDIRSVNQRQVIPNDLNVRHIPFARIVELLEQIKVTQQTLIFIDATGQQTRWLQYYLKQENIVDYYFLEGGISAWGS